MQPWGCHGNTFHFLGDSDPMSSPANRANSGNVASFLRLPASRHLARVDPEGCLHSYTATACAAPATEPTQLLLPWGAWPGLATAPRNADLETLEKSRSPFSFPSLFHCSTDLVRACFHPQFEQPLVRPIGRPSLETSKSLGSRY